MTLAGEDNKPREIAFLGKSFAIDIENGSTGWLLIGEGIRDWKPFPIDDVTPPSPGPSYKRGFSILLYAPKLLGSPEAHEMCSSTGAHLSFCERLYNEAEPQFGKGNVPIVKITEAEPIKVGKGKSRELQFEIVKWVPRPAAIVEALAKLKASTDAPPKKDAPHGRHSERRRFRRRRRDGSVAQGRASADKPEKKAKKGAERRSPNSRPSSDILDDEIPFLRLERGRSPSLERRSHPAGQARRHAGLVRSTESGSTPSAMLQKMADNYKVPIHELLLGAGSSGAGSNFDRQRAERAERKAREAELRAQRAEQAAREAHARPAEPDPEAPELPPDWRDRFAKAQELNRSRFFLTAWETNFVSDLIARGTRWPSPKQAVVIVRILEKAAAFSAASADADWEDVP